MAFTAAKAITRARDAHSAFDTHRNPDAVLLRMLSDYAVELHGKVAERDETALATEQVEDLPLADFEDGITLEANRYVLEATATAGDPNGTPYPIDLIPLSHRFDSQRGRGRYAWVVAGVLYLRGTANVWKEFAEVRIKYVPIPAELTTLAATIALPDTALRACAAHLAYQMACRGHNDASLPAIDAGSFARKAEKAEVGFLNDVSNRRTATVVKTRDIRGY